MGSLVNWCEEAEKNGFKTSWSRDIHAGGGGGGGGAPRSPLRFLRTENPRERGTKCVHEQILKIPGGGDDKNKLTCSEAAAAPVPSAFKSNPSELLHEQDFLGFVEVIFFFSQ